MTDGKPVEHLEATRRYYDEFARGYDDQRGGRVRGGYHDLIDELELGFLERFSKDKEVLEVGCGTGLLLERMLLFAKSARGIDLSPGMLKKARERGLEVSEASATDLPFDDCSFDTVCSFKVLAHVREIELAMREMLRVTRIGGTVVAEFYNPLSLRALAKRLGPAGRISDSTDEDAVFTRFDSPDDVRALLPAGADIIDRRGVRIVTPAAAALRVPIVGGLLQRAERALCDTPMSRFAGFWIAAIRRNR